MIKNYTSKVSVEKTVLRIEFALIKGGAIGIHKNYVREKLDSICFSVPDPKQRLVGIMLPANVNEVYEVLKSSMKRPRKETLKRLEEQAARTAWKLIQDWVEIQMSLIRMKQAEFLQVFLPYVWNGKQTFYGLLKESNFKLLSSGEK